jgi:hypothetical protein
MWYDRLDLLRCLDGLFHSPSSPRPIRFTLDSTWLDLLGQLGRLCLAGGCVDVALLNGVCVGRVDHTLDVALPVGGLAGGVSMQDVVGRLGRLHLARGLFLFITRRIPFSRLPGLPAGGRSKVLIPFLGSTVEGVSATRWYPRVWQSPSPE